MKLLKSFQSLESWHEIFHRLTTPRTQEKEPYDKANQTFLNGPVKVIYSCKCVDKHTYSLTFLVNQPQLVPLTPTTAPIKLSTVLPLHYEAKTNYNLVLSNS